MNLIDQLKMVIERMERHIDTEYDYANLIAVKNMAKLVVKQCQWQPIETAPPDQDLLLYCPEVGVTNYARIELAQARNTKSGSAHAWATHWMPLPEGPE